MSGKFEALPLDVNLTVTGGRPELAWDLAERLWPRVGDFELIRSFSTALGVEQVLEIPIPDSGVVKVRYEAIPDAKFQILYRPRPEENRVEFVIVRTPAPTASESRGLGLLEPVQITRDPDLYLTLWASYPWKMGFVCVTLWRKRLLDNER